MPGAGHHPRGAGRLGAAVLVAIVLAACAFAYAIGSAYADAGGRTSSAAPAAQTDGPDSRLTQEGEQEDAPPDREDCPEKDGEAGSGDGGGSSGSNGAPESDAPVSFSY